MKPDFALMKAAFQCRCPKCKTGALYQSHFSLDLNSTCPHCGLDLSDMDSGDGPAVFLIFILGFALVPIALIVEWMFALPLWVHAVIWSIAAIGITVLSLKPLKAYIIALQYKYRS